MQDIPLANAPVWSPQHIQRIHGVYYLDSFPISRNEVYWFLTENTPLTNRDTPILALATPPSWHAEGQKEKSRMPPAYYLSEEGMLYKDGDQVVLSHDSLAALKKAGWSYGQRVDPTPYEALMRQHDLPYHAKAEEFFMLFGGFAIASFPSQSRTEYHRFDILNLAREISPDLLRPFIDGRSISETACFIGTYDDGFGYFFVDSDGQFYMLHGMVDYLFKLGKTPFEFMEIVLQHDIW